MEEYGDFRTRRQQTVWHSLNRLLVALIAFTVITLIACAFVPELKNAREQDATGSRNSAAKSRKAARPPRPAHPPGRTPQKRSHLHRNHRSRPPRHDEGWRDHLPHRSRAPRPTNPTCGKAREDKDRKPPPSFLHNLTFQPSFFLPMSLDLSSVDLPALQARVARVAEVSLTSQNFRPA